MTITIPKRKFFERVDALPTTIRNLAFSTETSSLLASIGKNNHLDDRKIDTLIMLTGAVLMGFLHQTDLAKELQDAAKLDAKIAQAVADEVGQKIFSRVEADLNKIYEPIVSAEEPEETEVSAIPTPTPTMAIPTPAPSASLRIAFTPPKIPTGAEVPKPSSGPPAQAGPMMLHEEKTVAEEVKRGFRGFSMPLSFLRPKTAPEAPKTVARVETPGGTAGFQLPATKKEAQKVVHYSENRTPLSPFGEKQEFINLETFEKFSPPSQSYKGPNLPTTSKGEVAPPSAETPIAAATMPVSIKPVMEEGQSSSGSPVTSPAAPAPTPPPPAPPPALQSNQPISLEGGEPKISGNTVDLR